jgi:hypothetical protein
MANILKTVSLCRGSLPWSGSIASQHDSGALNASASGFFVLMTIPRSPLCYAINSCQHVIVFSHRTQPVSFRVPAHFVLIFILHSNANVPHSSLFRHPTYCNTSVPNDAVGTLASCSLGSGFQFLQNKTRLCWPIAFSFPHGLKNTPTTWPLHTKSFLIHASHSLSVSTYRPIKAKVKVGPLHAMKAYERIAPLILTLCARCRWVVTSNPATQ